MKSVSFVIKQPDESTRLDLYISNQFNNYSRSFIQRGIKEGSVIVNGQQVKKNYRLKKNDIVSLQEDFFDTVLKNKNGFNLESSSKPVDIIYKDDSLIVVNKQAGVCVYPSRGNTKDTLINRLVYRFRDLKNIGKENRFGLVHRIDKETSGIVLVALTSEALFFYSLQFEKRQVAKYYLAVVKGDISGLFKGRKFVEVNNYIGRHKKNRKKIAVTNKNNGRFALTRFRLVLTDSIPDLGKISLVRAEPKTGRTHQIRVHLSTLGFPIIGDKIYGKCNYDRMLLHAFRLKIRMLNGGHKVFEAGIPSEFCSLLNIDTHLSELK